jgi:hypothetical protein
MLGLGAQQLRRAFYILRRCAGRVRAGADANDVVGDVFGALCRLLGAAGDFLGRSALLLNCCGDRGRDLVDFADDATDRLDRLAFSLRNPTAPALRKPAGSLTGRAARSGSLENFLTMPLQA